MAKLSFYEQVGIVLPGAIFLSVLLFIVPGANAFLSVKGISIGEFGIFLIIAYAAGHAIAASGNVLEALGWRLRGGMPTDWVVLDDERILSAEQKKALLEKYRLLAGTTPGSIVGLSAKAWRPMFRQIYRAALAGNNPRIEAFNGNYGLNRGLCAAFILLAAIDLAEHPGSWKVSLALLLAAMIYGYRALRFAIHFAREVYVTFLNLPAPTGIAP